MKNLRKVLAVVLVVALAFSLVTIASAKFSDDASIKYKEAVGVMSGIGAINGYTDGSFKPAGLVTRAEAAKMIAYAILGPTVAGSLTRSASTFKDVPTTLWANPFIEYCASKGIINGVGNGNFNPDGNVTGVELAKMMLCAAGYGVNKEYVGANWAVNVVTDAMRNDIFLGNESKDFSLAASREEAALYIFNGLWVDQVQYNQFFGYYGKGTTVTSGAAGDSIAEEIYNMANPYGIVVGGTVDGTAVAGTNVAIADIDDVSGKATALADASTNFKFDCAVSDIGKMVSIYWNTVTGKVYFTENVSSAVVVKTAFSASAQRYVSAFGTLTFGTATQYLSFPANYASAPTEYTAAGSIGLTVGATAAAGTYATFAGQIVSFIAPGTRTMEKVTAINTALGAESITLTSGLLSNNATSDVVNAYTGIAVGDYVTVTTAGTMNNVEKVTKVDGSISKVDYVAGAENAVTLGGTVYNAAVTTGLGGSGVVKAFPVASADFTGNTYTLYLDSTGKFITSALKTGSSASSVVYVTGPTWQAVGDYGLTYKVQAVNTAGEVVLYNAGTSDPTGTIGTVGGFFKVSVDSTTGIATFSASIGATDYAAASGVDTSLSTADITNPSTVNGFTYYYAPDVNFIFVSGTGAKVKVTKLTGLASVAGTALDATDELFFNNVTGGNKTVNTVICTSVFTGASASKTVFIKAGTTPAGASADGTMYNVYIDGVKTLVTSKDTSVSSIAGNFVSYVVDSKGIYDFTGISPVTRHVEGATVTSTGVFGSYVTTGSNTYSAAGAVVVDLSQASGLPAVYTSLAAMETAGKTFTVSYALNADDVITVLYVTAAV